MSTATRSLETLDQPLLSVPPVTLLKEISELYYPGDAYGKRCSPNQVSTESLVHVYSRVRHIFAPGVNINGFSHLSDTATGQTPQQEAYQEIGFGLSLIYDKARAINYPDNDPTTLRRQEFFARWFGGLPDWMIETIHPAEEPAAEYAKRELPEALFVVKSLITSTKKPFKIGNPPSDRDDVEATEAAIDFVNHGPEVVLFNEAGQVLTDE